MKLIVLVNLSWLMQEHDDTRSTINQLNANNNEN